MSASSHRAGSFAERLDRLFRTVVDSRTGKPHSVRAVASALDVSHTHLNKLRTGQATDPRVSEMEALAAFFGVPLAYFTDDLGRSTDASQASAESQRRLAAALAQPGINRVAQRMAGAQLSEEAVDAIIAMIDQVVQLEKAARQRRGKGGTHGPTQ